MIDHIDWRVRDLAKVRPLYDALLPAFGLSDVRGDSEGVCYFDARDPKGKPFFGIIVDARHRPGETRVAFRAASQAEVDRLAAIAEQNGATAYEAPQMCPEYTPNYYAAFFEDAEGNKLEICYRF